MTACPADPASWSTGTTCPCGKLVAPFGPSWRGGAADATSGSDYTSHEFPPRGISGGGTGSGGDRGGYQ
jgi:hypothetical protein